MGICTSTPVVKFDGWVDTMDRRQDRKYCRWKAIKIDPHQSYFGVEWEELPPGEMLPIVDSLGVHCDDYSELLDSIGGNVCKKLCLDHTKPGVHKGLFNTVEVLAASMMPREELAKTVPEVLNNVHEREQLFSAMITLAILVEPDCICTIGPKRHGASACRA